MQAKVQQIFYWIKIVLLQTWLNIFLNLRTFKDEKNIYIARQTGLVGILGTLEVIHNGNSVAELGHKEIIKIRGLSGENSLKIKGKGLNAMVKGKTIKFDIIDDKNRFRYSNRITLSLMKI